MRREPFIKLAFLQSRKFLKDVDPLQQLVDTGRREVFGAPLHGDETVFHRVRQFDDEIHVYDPRSTLDRVGGPHQLLDVR